MSFEECIWSPPDLVSYLSILCFAVFSALVILLLIRKSLGARAKPYVLVAFVIGALAGMATDRIILFQMNCVELRE